MKSIVWMAVVCATLSVTASAQTIVIPAANATTDGNSRFWIAGTIQARRQLTILDGSQLLPLVGHSITALSFRRNAENEAFQGGDATLTVRLSHSPHAANAASPQFAANHGADLTTVFQGTVALPSSPATTATSVAWSAANTLQVVFQQPFAYVGGALAIDVTGVPGANATQWWPADAVWQQNGGSVASVGTGSGGYGGPTGAWALFDAGNLGPGGTVTFQALGAPGDLAVLGVAASTQVQRIDISAFGVPGSCVHIADPFLLELALFDQPLVPQAPGIGAVASSSAQVPTDPAFLGVSMGSQWFAVDVVGRIASSNAHQWAIAALPPSLPMALVTAPVLGAEPAVGKVVPACGHVLRFDYQ